VLAAKAIGRWHYDPSIWPLLTALAVSAMFVGSIFTPWALVWGAVPIGAAVTGWFWPKRRT